MNSSQSPRGKKSYPEETKEFWLNHFAKMKESNLSRIAYCRCHGLNYDRMQYWRKQLLSAPVKKLLPVSIKETKPTLDKVSTKSNVLAHLQLSNGLQLSITSHEAFRLLLDKVICHAAII